MTLLFIIFSSFTSIFSRLVNSISKHIFLIASVLIAIPTLYDWEEIDVYYTTDGIADILILLTIYLLPISIISNWNNIKSNLYFELVLNLGIILLINFMCQDMTSFYVYFEASLIPLFILIGLYGAANKDKAADYILIYFIFIIIYVIRYSNIWSIIR